MSLQLRRHSKDPEVEHLVAEAHLDYDTLEAITRGDQDRMQLMSEPYGANIAVCTGFKCGRSKRHLVLEIQCR